MNCAQQIVIRDEVTEQLALGTASVGVVFPESPAYSFSNGTSTAGTVPNVIDLHWEKGSLGGSAVTLAASASVTYTLSALTDDQGRAVAFARLHGFTIRVIATTAGSGDFLTVGGAATHPCLSIVNGTFIVKDYEKKVAQDAVGLVVAAGSSDQLKILNSGANPMTFEIALSGCST